MNRVVAYTVLITILFVCCAPAQTPCDDLSKYPARFAILGDRTGSHQEGVYEAVVEQVALMRPDFAMTVGDMIEGYTSDTLELRKQWDEYLGIVKPLSALLHFTPGNHDITYDGMESTFRSRVADPFYSFDVRGLHMVILDNSRCETTEEFPAAQIDWLKDDLAKHQDACYTMVFFHKPFWYRTLGAGKSDALHDIFKANGVDAVFSGHFHNYFSAAYDGIQYTCIGSSGGAAEEIPEGLLYHFGWATIDGSGIHVVPIKKDAVLPWSVQTVAEARTASDVQSNGINFTAPVALADNMTLKSNTIAVRLENRVTGSKCEDTLSWELPEGWVIEPADYPFSLAGGNSLSTEFKITHSSKLYPLPTLTTKLPYAEGKATKISRTLEVARTAHCINAVGGIKIDGALTEPCWQKPQSQLLANDGSDASQDSANFYFAYDKENFYMAVRCLESKPDSIRASMTERDAAVYTEDAVGVMFQPESQVPVMYQFYINPIGTVYDQRIERQTDGYWVGLSNWNGECEVKTSIRDGFFVVELRVPLAQFSTTADESDSWRVNFRRKQLRLNSAAQFQSPWQYDPRTFGVLEFD